MILIYITNNSIKNQSLVNTHLNNQTVLFQTFQFSISLLFALSLDVKQFFLPTDRTLLGASSPARVDLGAITINGYSAFSKAPALLEPRHQIV